MLSSFFSEIAVVIS